MTEQQGSLELAPAVGVLVLLLADVRPDLLQLESDRGHGIATRPEMLPGKVALRPAKLPRNRNSTLALQAPDHLCHRHLGRNRDTHMDMLWHDLPFDNLTLLLARQRMEDRAQLPPDLFLQRPPSFGLGQTSSSRTGRTH